MSEESKIEPIQDSRESGILWMHIGHSANCSSIGSLIDFLFLGSVASAALISVVTAIRSTENKEEILQKNLDPHSDLDQNDQS